MGMIVHSLLFTLIATTLSAQVTIRNVSFPYTALEVGNTVQVSISGATPFGTVTVVENGGVPYAFGATDASGNWSVSNEETAPYVTNYNQVWYVNGSPLTPVNADPTYFPYAPRLPNFSVYSNFVGSNCPPQSPENEGCGTPGNARRWVWSPITYGTATMSTVVNSSTFSTAASTWNSITGGKLSFSSDNSVRQDLTIGDDNSIGSFNADVVSYGQDCTGCTNRIDVCSGACLNPAAMFSSIMRLNISEMTTAAGFWGMNVQAFAPLVVAHEMGHVLRMGHSLISHGKCSEVTSIMYPS